MELPAVGFVWLVLQYLPRRPSLITATLLGGASLLATRLMPPGGEMEEECRRRDVEEEALVTGPIALLLVLVLVLLGHRLRAARALCGHGDVGKVQRHHVHQPAILLHSGDLPHGRQDHRLWPLQHLRQGRHLHRSFPAPTWSVAVAIAIIFSLFHRVSHQVDVTSCVSNM